MAQGKQQPKFERNPCVRFRDNCDTNRRQTTDKFRFYELCWHGQAELKMAWRFGGQVVSPKICVNSLDGFCEKWFYGRTRDDGLPRDDTKILIENRNVCEYSHSTQTISPAS